MSIKRYFVLLAFLLSPGASFAGQLFAVTPSGTPETIFAGSAAETVGKLSSKCMDAHWTVTSATANEVLCEAPLSTGKSILAQVLIGNSYSTTPRRFFRFNIVEVAGVSRAQASGWAETQMAFGQVQRVDFSGADFQNDIMGFMVAAGGKYPAGTSFPNHVFMGFLADKVPEGKYEAFRVKELTANAPASRAGMQVGDIVTSVAGHKFKNDLEYLEARAKAVKSPTYEVEVERNGQPVTLTLDREFHPPSTEIVSAKPASASQATAAATTFVADELSKLAKLKEEGILTQEEFDSQKAKLLAK